MYTVSIPIILSTTEDYGIDKYLAEVKRAKVDRVMLAISNGPGDSVFNHYEKDKDSILSLIRRAYKLFKAEGYEVGLWFWSFMMEDTKFTHITSPNGTVCESECCPADENFIKYSTDFLKTMASTGVDFILLDDDYRLGFFHNVLVGCTCPLHMKMISDDLGEKVTREDIKDHLLSGGKNKYRSAFIRANRKSLLDYATTLRKELDTINPNTRLGVCSCISSWDIDGANSVEISKALAGNTKPLLRLIGAPYWAAHNEWGNRLSDVIELMRLERSWCDDDLEIISEGDTYPRPTFETPASYLEMYDVALRADGTLSGALKYMLDYVSSPAYETKYIDSQVKNFDLYEKIAKHFGDKKACGVRVFEAPAKYENMEISKLWESSEFVANLFFPIAPKVLSACSVPSKYYGEGVGIALGENVKYIPENAAKNGLIIDIAAAEILHNKGVDVGLTKLGGMPRLYKQKFLSGEVVRIAGVCMREIEVSEKAEIRSIHIYENGECPGSYIYENENGEKYCVLNFDAYWYTNFNENKCFYSNYEIQKDFAYIYKALCGKKLPAHSVGNPYFYLLAKKNDDESAMAVCAFNFSADVVENKIIDLDDEYNSIEFIAGSGNLCGDKVALDTIPAFSYAIFEVKK